MITIWSQIEWTRRLANSRLEVPGACVYFQHLSKYASQSVTLKPSQLIGIIAQMMQEFIWKNINPIYLKLNHTWDDLGIYVGSWRQYLRAVRFAHRRSSPGYRWQERREARSSKICRYFEEKQDDHQTGRSWISGGPNQPCSGRWSRRSWIQNLRSQKRRQRIRLLP